MISVNFIEGRRMIDYDFYDMSCGVRQDFATPLVADTLSIGQPSGDVQNKIEMAVYNRQVDI